MYGFWGVGQLEVRFGRVSPWRDNRRTRKDRATQPMDHGRLRWAIEKKRLSHQVWSHGRSTFKKNIKRPFFPLCTNWPICIYTRSYGLMIRTLTFIQIFRILLGYLCGSLYNKQPRQIHISPTDVKWQFRFRCQGGCQMLLGDFGSLRDFFQGQRPLLNSKLLYHT